MVKQRRIVPNRVPTYDVYLGLPVRRAYVDVYLSERRGEMLKS